jgi:penicillin-binding protein 2
MDLFQSRKRLLTYVFVGLIAIYIIKLFYLQVIDTSYKQLAKNTVLRRVTIFPARGLIYDRNHNLLVENQAEYDLMVVPGQMQKIDTNLLCSLINISDSDFKINLQKAREYSKYKPSLFVRGLSTDQYAKLEEELYLFPGFYADVRTVRKYDYPNAAHVLGYISEVSQKQIDGSKGYYQPGDYIGVNGIEDSYEKELRGQRGTKYVVVDVHNREQGSFGNGALDTLAISGKNLITSIDIKLQQYGEELMQGKVGSVVAIEPETGEILALISSPEYDPDSLTGNYRAKNFKALLNDPMHPLFDRPLKAAYPPGSTFKAINALIGLQTGGIEPQFGVVCNGGYNVGSLHVGCHPHPPIDNLEAAIQYSCNTYFCTYFRRTIDLPQFHGVAQGLDTWHHYANGAGLGVKLGIDLPNEGYGFIPDSKYYDKIYHNRPWTSTTVISLAIGQGEIGVTPLQLANLYTAIANRGWYISPHVVKNIDGNDTALKKYLTKHLLPFDQKNYAIIIQGLENVVEAGTATDAQIPGVQLVGKTGTAQNPHGRDHSLFACFAPENNPKIVIACVVENGGHGAEVAAPIASLMIEKYLNDSISAGRKDLEKRMIALHLY